MTCVGEAPEFGPLITQPRKRMIAKRRAEIFGRHRGCCHLCAGRIKVGEAWEVEHVLPLSMGGTDDDDNLAPAHVKCHARKTSVEAGTRAKADRIRAKHTGTAPPPLQKIKSRGFAKRWER